MAPGSLQAALPREMYVDAAAPGAPSGRPCCSASGTASAALDDLGLDAPSRVRRGRRRRASRCSSPATSDGALHAAYNVCRHRGSQLARPRQPAPRAAASALRCPYHSWTYGLDGRLLQAPHADASTDLDALRAAPGRRRDLGRVRVRAPHARAARRRWPTQVGARRRDAGQLRPRPTWSPAQTLTLRRRRQLQGAARELQRVLPLRPGAPRAVAGWCRRSPAAARDLDWDDGIPHREGAWTFTMTGTTTRAPLPGLDEDERTRHKGDLVYPNLMLSASADHVAAFVLQPARRRPHRRRLLAAVRRRRGGRGRRSTRATPPSCGTWSTSRTGRSASRCSAACRRAPTARLVRADGGRQPRHPALAAAAAWSEPADDRARRLRRRRARRARQRHRLGAGPPRPPVLGLERFELGHARGASHDTSRILRHSYHTPAYVRLTQEAYADWARLERESGDGPGHHGRRARPVPAGRRRSRRSTTRESMDEVGIAYEAARRRRGDARAGRSSGCPTGRWRCTRPTRAIVPAGARHRGDAGPGPAARRRPARAHARARRRATSARPASRSTTAARRASTARGVVVSRRRVGQRRARPPRPARAARGDARAGHLLRSRPTRRLRARAAAAVDLDGRPVVLRLPVATASRPSRPPRTAAARSVDPDDRTSEPDPAMEALLAEHLRAMLPGQSARRCGRCAASTRSPPTATSCISPVPGPRVASSSGWAPRTASSSRRRSAGCSPTSSSTGTTTTDLSAFRLDRPALTDPAYRAALAGVT